MKKNNLLVVAATLVYSYLFYQQSAGINCLLFTLLFNIALVIKDPALFQHKLRILLSVSSIVAGIGVTLNGGNLAVFANLISLALVSVFSLAETSVMTAIIHSLCSMATSWINTGRDLFEKRKAIDNDMDPEQENSAGVKILVIGIPVLITILFFFLYRSSNAIFNNYAQQINLNFISFSWIFYTLFSFLIVSGLFFPKLITQLYLGESQLQQGIHKSETKNSLFGGTISIGNEYLSGFVLLIMLNLLLLSVNFIDIQYFLFSIGQTDANFSEAVHQGIGALIVSILIAISIILVYFRAHLNFYKKSASLRLLAYVWVSQNIFMILSTVYKNALYIREYGLTYKRIGVYVYLLLALIGLIITLLKIARVKTAWYMISKNMWMAYLVLVTACIWNWDGFITSYNLQWAKEKHKTTDTDYLISLSNNNIPTLLPLANDPAAYNLSETEQQIVKEKLKTKFDFYKIQYQFINWQSMTYCDYMNYKKLSDNNK